jgi:hypothetical protein
MCKPAPPLRDHVVRVSKVNSEENSKGINFSRALFNGRSNGMSRTMMTEGDQNESAREPNTSIGPRDVVVNWGVQLAKVLNEVAPEEFEQDSRFDR